MPVRQARSHSRGRHGASGRRGGTWGSKGRISSHNSSVRIGLAIAPASAAYDTHPAGRQLPFLLHLLRFTGTGISMTFSVRVKKFSPGNALKLSSGKLQTTTIVFQGF